MAKLYMKVTFDNKQPERTCKLIEEFGEKLSEIVSPNNEEEVGKHLIEIAKLCILDGVKYEVCG